MSTKELTNEKQTISVSEIAITGVCIALTFIATGFINIRLPIAANGGLVHLGQEGVYHGIPAHPVGVPAPLRGKGLDGHQFRHDAEQQKGISLLPHDAGRNLVPAR